MDNEAKVSHPYIPNSAPAVKRAMLQAVEAESVEDLYGDVPREVRLRGEMELPAPLGSEWELKRHVDGLLAENIATNEYLSFLGAGCYQHHIPAVCDEISMRGEFLSAYSGRPYEDHGRYQALFEYSSLMGELLEMDVVSFPLYDEYQATATALRMACRISGRSEVLLPRHMNPDKLAKIQDYCKPDIKVGLVDFDFKTGAIDLDGLLNLMTDQIAAVHFENPAYLGMLEGSGREISEIAHRKGALCVVSANPLSLGILSPPVSYGADIVTGDIQPLGIHMQFGGGHAGFIASSDEERLVLEYPTRLWGIAPTRVPGEYGFGDVAFERTSFAQREKGKEWVGTTSAMWGIVAAAYLALLGPQGMVEIGENIMARARYAMLKMAEIDGICLPFADRPHFGEFIVQFESGDRTVEEINRALLSRRIFGGKDISAEFPELGRSALFCVSEVHSQSDIDALVAALKEVLQ
jgi:glycine dehydrogenase subunit 1